MPLSRARFVSALLALAVGGCPNFYDPDGEDTDGDDYRCGPPTAFVRQVIDGDTIELDSGERVRYILVDAPEVDSLDCWASEATDFNRDLVEGETVRLSYDEECEDNYGRLLAYVNVDEREINSLLVERGHACVLHISPNGDDRVDEFEALEASAQAEGKGLWGACAVVTCDD